ncbi:MAG: AAA family ATPase, partial [Gammaproteobacteria bacterium]|nr:AAA family ATPase [Gammaproteobacteria bacterium]
MTCVMGTQQAVQAQRTQHLAALLRQYQLERDPFADSGISGLFYPGGDRKNVVDALLHFSRYGTAPLFLSAPAGFGKTSILLEFASRVEPDVDCAVVTAEMLLTPAQLQQDILRAFGIDGPVHDQGGEEFVAWLRAQAQRNRQAVLCIDNAQHLEKEFVRQLVALVADSELALKLVFAGQPDARLLLENAVEQQGMLFNTLELAELSQTQVEEYIQYRLAAAGYRGEFPLSKMQVQAAALRSRGSIAQVNDLVRDLLIAGLDAGKDGRAPVFPVPHILLAAVVAGITVFFAYRSLEQPAPQANAPIKLEKVPTAATAQGQAGGNMANNIANNRAAENNDLPAREPVTPDAGGSAASGAAANVPASVAIARAGSSIDGAAQPAARSTVAPSSGDIEPAKAGAGSAADRRDRPLTGAANTGGGGGEKTGPVAAATAALGQPAEAQQPSATVQLQRVYQRLQAWPDEGYA